MDGGTGQEGGPWRRWSPARLLADRSLRVKGLTVVGIPVIALGASMAMDSRTRDRDLAAAAQVARLIEIQKQVAVVRNLTVDSETGVRGWLLTGDPAFLAPYEQASGQLRPAVDHLAALVADRPGQKARAEELRWLTADQFAVSERLRSADQAREGTGVDGTLRRGRVATDAVRAGLAALDDAVGAELADQRAVADDTDQQSRVAMATIFVSGVLGAAAALAVFIRSIERRIEMLRDNAARLADGEPVRLLPAGADEIGELGQRMAAASELLVQRERELRAATDLAERANRAKTEFLSRMSHELRTPLNAMLGFAQILEMEDLGQGQREDVHQILRGGRHLLGLINEVLDISRIETGDLAISIEPVALPDVVAEVRRLLEPLAVPRGITLIDDPSLVAASLIRADRQRVSQILLNLVSNAIKYNVEGGTVTVAAGAPRPGVVRVTVTDTGPGISTQSLELIFAPFERLGAERTTVEGTGIGLALSRRLAEAMEGTLAVESRPGKGSTFWVEVPAALDPAGVPIAGSGTSRDDDGDGRVAVAGSDGTVILGRGPAGAGSERSLVLCIDDNDANLKVVEAALARVPALDVVSAGLARVGVDLARQHRPDLVLLDLHLPDLTGEDVLRMLRTHQETATIPVVVVSADATPGAVRRLLDHGAQAYLTKPLDIRQLLDCVREHIPARATDQPVP